MLRGRKIGSLEKRGAGLIHGDCLRRDIMRRRALSLGKGDIDGEVFPESRRDHEKKRA